MLRGSPRENREVTSERFVERRKEPDAPPRAGLTVDDAFDLPSDGPKEGSDLTAGVLANMAHVSKRPQLRVLSERVGADAGGTSMNQEVLPPSQREQVRRRQHEQPARGADAEYFQRGADEIKTKVLEDFAHQNCVECVVRERQTLSLDVTPNHVQPKPLDATGESIRINVQAGDVEADLRQGSRHHRRSRSDLKESTPEVDVVRNKIEIVQESVVMRCEILSRPVRKGWVVRLNRTGNRIQHRGDMGVGGAACLGGVAVLTGRGVQLGFLLASVRRSMRW